MNPANGERRWSLAESRDSAILADSQCASQRAFGMRRPQGAIFDHSRWANGQAIPCKRLYTKRM